MITEMSGPLLVAGASAAEPNGNPDAGLSLAWGGFGMMDSRKPYAPGGSGTVSTLIYGFTDNGSPPCIDAIPSTLTTTAIAAAQTPTSGNPLNLVATTAAGVTVLPAVITVQPSGTQIPAGTLAIDGPSGYATFSGSFTGAVGLYDPTKALSRNVQIASVGNDTGATFTVAGYDIYGYPMHETITGVSASTAKGKKAFKYVTSITPAGTLSGSNVSAGQGDTYGLPLAAGNVGYTTIFWNSTPVSGLSGTFTPADTTNPATYTTGDVRGTFLVPSASNGTSRLIVFVTVSVANLVQGALGITGVTPA